MTEQAFEFHQNWHGWAVTCLFILRNLRL